VVLVMSEDEFGNQYRMFYTKKDFDQYGSNMYWVGTFVGAVGTALIGFVSLYLVGTFIN
jgi:hypothetical protein